MTTPSAAGGNTASWEAGRVQGYRAAVRSVRDDRSRNSSDAQFGLNVGRRFGLGLSSVVDSMEWKDIKADSEVEVGPEVFRAVLHAVELGLWTFETNFIKVREMLMHPVPAVASAAQAAMIRFLGSMPSQEENPRVLTNIINGAFEQVKGISASTREAMVAFIMKQPQLQDYTERVREAARIAHGGAEA